MNLTLQPDTKYYINSFICLIIQQPFTSWLLKKLSGRPWTALEEDWLQSDAQTGLVVTHTEQNHQN
jgi:hypothetical protein